MCPDGETLSAYFDDELDRMGDKRIADHVSECEACAGKLGSFSRLTAELRAVHVPDIDEDGTQEKIWRAVEAAKGHRPVPIWGRRVSLPLPVAAAIAAVFVAAVGIGIFPSSIGGSTQAVPAVASTQHDVASADFQVDNLSDLMGYLDSKDFGNSVTIQLPKGVDEMSVGKPQLIRAADFKRGQ